MLYTSAAPFHQHLSSVVLPKRLSHAFSTVALTRDWYRLPGGALDAVHDGIIKPGLEPPKTRQAEPDQDGFLHLGKPPRAIGVCLLRDQHRCEVIHSLKYAS